METKLEITVEVLCNKIKTISSEVSSSEDINALAELVKATANLVSALNIPNSKTLKADLVLQTTIDVEEVRNEIYRRLTENLSTDDNFLKHQV